MDDDLPTLPPPARQGAVRAGLVLCVWLAASSSLTEARLDGGRMARFDDAIGVILEHEGGYVNDPADPGGETNFGISHKAYPNEDIKNLTVERAKVLYRRDYWDSQWEQLTSQPLATALLDASVNMGRVQAVKLLQRAVNQAMCRDYLSVDGIFGMQTLEAANKYAEPAVQEFRAQRSLFYIDLAWNQPAMKKFLPGWIRRAVV